MKSALNRTGRIAGIAVIAAIALAAKAPEKTMNPDTTVPVCVEGIALDVMAQSEPIASKIFSSIGVTIQWHSQGRHCPALAIQIRLADGTPDSFMPGGLAYAVPGEGTRIVLFYDRILVFQTPEMRRVVLAHVLVHEIAHILEGICRHSESGVMKAHWGQKDYTEMAWHPLPFADEDVDLIHNGLLSRTARAAWAENQEATMVATRR